MEAVGIVDRAERIVGRHTEPGCKMEVEAVGWFEPQGRDHHVVEEVLVAEARGSEGLLVAGTLLMADPREPESCRLLVEAWLAEEDNLRSVV